MRNRSIYRKVPIFKPNLMSIERDDLRHQSSGRYATLQSPSHPSHWSPIPKIAALLWRIEHEKMARDEYQGIQKKQHTSFKLGTTGLCVNPKYPHHGASPDGLFSCKCCGLGVLTLDSCFDSSTSRCDSCPFPRVNAGISGLTP